MKLLLLLALAVVVWVKGRMFFAKIWLAFVSPTLSKIDKMAERTVVFRGADVIRPLTPQEAEEIRK